MNEFKIQELQPTNSIRFFNGGNPAESRNEVLRISRDGIWANPDISVDEATQLVLKALDVSIKQMVARAVDAEREEIVKDFMARHEETKHSHNFWHVAANQVKARGNK